MKKTILIGLFFFLGLFAYCGNSEPYENRVFDTITLFNREIDREHLEFILKFAESEGLDSIQYEGNMVGLDSIRVLHFYWPY